MAFRWRLGLQELGDRQWSFVPAFGRQRLRAGSVRENQQEEYEKTLKAFPKIDYSQLGRYETEDNTDGRKV